MIPKKLTPPEIPIHTMLPQSAGRLRSPSDPSGIQRKKPRAKAPAQFAQIEEETDTAAINDEVEFGKWYHDVEEDLLDASHEAYQYVRSLRQTIIIRLT